MKKLLVGMAAVSVALAGCGGSEQVADSTVEPGISETSEAPAPGPATNARGNIEKEVGVKSGAGSIEAEGLTWTITNMADTGSCGIDPDYGRMLAVDIAIETGPSYDPNNFNGSRGGIFAGSDWMALSDGITIPNINTAASAMCASGHDLPSDLSPGSSYEGRFVFDLPPSAEALILRPSCCSKLGWEWLIPSALEDAPVPAASAEYIPSPTPAWTPEPPAATATPRPPVGYTAGPVGPPAPLVGKVIDYCMTDQMYQGGTTQFTDGTTGWTEECAG